MIFYTKIIDTQCSISVSIVQIKFSQNMGLNAKFKHSLINTDDLKSMVYFLVKIFNSIKVIEKMKCQ